MNTLTGNRTTHRHDGIAHEGHGIMQDWPNVAPAMAAILTSGAIVVALMVFVERFLMR